MADVKVTALEVTGSDERGANYNWECDRTGTFMVCTRKAGSTSGQHYHEGKRAFKAPEVQYLVHGIVKVHYCGLDQKIIASVTVEAPARIEIPIMLWHEVEAITDCVLMEMNSLEDVQQDSVRIWRKDFEERIKTL
ncbi:hypothetical protein MKQ68_06745 [Chitinophaga horti]|uniref:Cupin domain-containing protein n=1 Tax=Chitinophaga horti TaxID=2920382 RepID=A0ABY6J535_9BACT|nr:hypothetical protein [Chitinophaga horti]UYQ94788.1 hypothetical protein MKQ68_06745 [Chitinophaga horti]